jgi:hypothetical protein
MKPRLGLLILAATAAVALAAVRPQAGASQRSPRTAAQQDSARQRLQALMREKVSRAEVILRGLAQGDLRSVQKAADELVQIAARANWSVNAQAGQVAAVNEAEFQRRAALLAKFARDGDLHASYYQFMQVVFQCFDCHEELRPPRR